jgi:DNA-binding CsgD family transcriptional regulator
VNKVMSQTGLAKKRNVSANDTHAYSSSSLAPATSAGWADAPPELWLECWSGMDGRARLLVTSERVLLCCDNKTKTELESEENLRQRGLRIEPADPGELKNFEAFLEVTEGNINTYCLPRRRRGGHLLMRASLLKMASGMPLVGITFHGTGSDFVPRWADIAAIFGLTSAEHRIVQLLLNGVSPETIASAQKLSINTVRTHISHAYDKLGVSSRDALWRQLAAYRIN